VGLTVLEAVLQLLSHAVGHALEWEQISGVFADTPAFDEAVALGRQYREAQRPAADEGTDVSA
jgi:hypothetical protein